MTTTVCCDLNGKNAIVTGGAMGIGLATCKRLLNEGCRVAIWDVNQEALSQAAREFSHFDGRVFTYVCDIADRASVEAVAKKTEADLGRVDFLINNAGFVRAGLFTEIPPEVHERMTAVNLTAIYYTLHAFLPRMLERNSGHVVNISSAGGMTGVPYLAVYSATKWAVWGLTESLRMETCSLKKDGVRFTSVHPHFIAKGMFEGGRLSNWLGRLMMPGIETHDVVAEAIVEKALKKGRQQILLPWTLWLIMAMRCILPSGAFAWFMNAMGLAGAMNDWKGRPGTEHAGRG